MKFKELLNLVSASETIVVEGTNNLYNTTYNDLDYDEILRNADVKGIYVNKEGILTISFQ
ncbi:hypothetical protein FJQ98_15920 [Lysinibacillus agricola]|uniref:Uncharacterized protein n=1 Tax=Lysinibacillus agricola TaxID=2590012 RepID=A0ABX7AML3_9BACI|nr:MULTISPECIES: hypothetical protein [Lysinibacillus]KOS61566.1 hypothetical protein AN161_18440 [Lysinibacillus sp. FJAT-14222]QQP10732.1 hypothetical protein FJQ98_15920 [Lysinibacillus agricola]